MNSKAEWVLIIYKNEIEVSNVEGYDTRSECYAVWNGVYHGRPGVTGYDIMTLGEWKEWNEGSESEHNFTYPAAPLGSVWDEF